MNSEQINDSLVALNTTVEIMVKKLDDLPCGGRGEEIAAIKTKVESHDKFMWISIGSSISSLFGVIFIGVQLYLKSMITKVVP